MSAEIRPRTLVIAEAGVNHNGDVALAKKLCDAAREAGADIVKFQLFRTEAIVTREASQADYQRENTGQAESQYDMLKKLELSSAQMLAVKEHCERIGIEFLATPDDDASLDDLVAWGVRLIKVGSGETTNVPFLRRIGATKKPVILSTGMTTLAEVEGALNALVEGGAERSSITILHCTTAYPTPWNEVNLRAMDTLRAAFQLPVGFSDHTMGIDVPLAAVALGATVIEKHFTLDRAMEGPDHKASITPVELSALVLGVRRVEQALGTGLKIPTASEVGNRSVVRKVIVAAKAIERGEVLGAANLTVKRAATGLSAVLWDHVAGRAASRAFRIDEAIEL